MYLVDTNIFLEVMLEQIEADTVKDFLQRIDNAEIYISDFSLHSIGIILFRREKEEVFNQFLNDIAIDTGVHIISLEPQDLLRIVEVVKRYNLDFDDAYQYLVAEKFGLQIVSLDSNFDRADKGRTMLERLNIVK